MKLLHKAESSQFTGLPRISIGANGSHYWILYIFVFLGCIEWLHRMHECSCPVYVGNSFFFYLFHLRYVSVLWNFGVCFDYLIDNFMNYHFWVF